MRFALWFWILIMFWILIELSFLEIMLPGVRAPLFLMALVVALAVTMAEQSGFWWALGAVIVFNILQSGSLTGLAFFLVLVAAGASFLSRRLLFQRQQAHYWLLGGVVVLAVAGYEILFPFPALPRPLDLALSVPFSFMVSWSVERLGEWLRTTSLLEFRGMRHS